MKDRNQAFLRYKASSLRDIHVELEWGKIKTAATLRKPVLRAGCEPNAHEFAARKGDSRLAATIFVETEFKCFHKTGGWQMHDEVSGRGW